MNAKAVRAAPTQSQSTTASSPRRVTKTRAGGAGRPRAAPGGSSAILPPHLPPGGLPRQRRHQRGWRGTKRCQREPSLAGRGVASLPGGRAPSLPPFRDSGDQAGELRRRRSRWALTRRHRQQRQRRPLPATTPQQLTGRPRRRRRCQPRPVAGSRSAPL